MLSRFSMWMLNRLGWSIQADLPEEEKYVLVVAHHTSNWDFPLGTLAKWAARLDAHWIGKHTLFRWPFGWFFRALGGIPVRRDQAQNLIQQIAGLYADSPRLVLAVTPEGTRGRTDHWKTGFYHIARAANVPITMACLDYGKKQVAIGGTFYPGDDIEEAFTAIRAFYASRRGKYPEKESLIQARKR